MTEIVLASPLAGWAMPLADVPDPVFARGMMGDGVAIEPTGDTLHAPCAGTILTIHAARHAVTMDTGGVELLMHIGIDSVAMAGAGFEALVAPGDVVPTGTPLIRFDLDRLVREASAATTPVIVTGTGVRIDHRHAGGLVTVGDPLLRATIATEPVDVRVAGETRRRDVTVELPHGLHARPAARIVAALRALDATATLHAGDRLASAGSAIALLGLGLGHGVAVRIAAEGPDADHALDAIARLLAREEEAAPPIPLPAPTAVDLPARALAGVAAAPGVAIGPAHWLRRALPAPPDGSDAPEAEWQRLDRAMAEVRAALADTHGHAAGVFAAHREILDDPALADGARTEIDRGANAAAAILTVARRQAALLRAGGDARIAERGDDIVDVGERVAHAVLGTSAGIAAPPAGAVLLAEDLLPSHFAALDAGGLAGIALVRGGPTAHVAILAAGAGVPMAVALGAPVETIAEGTPLLLDGDIGYVVPDPADELLARTRATIARRAEAERRARAIGASGVTTADGVAVAVQANCGSADDAAAALAAGADGCGLLRTEFLFLDRATPPDADEQAAAYRAVLDALPDRTITIRLLDVGGDKPAPYLSLPTEENPALGVRGVRVSLARADLLEAQLSAILSLDAQARVRIMVPMVASAGEVAAVRVVLARLGGGQAVLGAMVETPAAAIGADLIAREADFLSIGSNDLTQYALAADRGNAGVAAMLDGLHPAVLRLIAETCARAGDTPVSVCGGLAADPLAAPILIGLGIRSLSVPPARVAAIKALVAGLTLPAARAHAQAALACAAATEVRTLARRFAQEMPS